ncbi:hypothetical protein [Apilactobacillus apinorum]|uniref:hypothetical protein n=1 Tax=Apilactobacillus apinorum TaxID=1218495 RepID=UPI0006B452BA|nr:hypothetical protein [Apilactobacillus apinorum]KOY68439.1 hypothetical protein RZ74_09900 [Apilactobacillus apinorum]CAI2685557.1 Hypothetical protein AAPFHON13_10800 [Apilactobacillus apinorum]
MGEKLYHFSELSEQAKVTSINAFSKFYVICYRSENMEILSQVPDQSMLWQINQEVYRNKYESVDHAAKDTIIYCSHSYEKLLNEIDMRYLANGSTEFPWESWYQQKYAALPHGV